jgi:hypothetical protein
MIDHAPLLFSNLAIDALSPFGTVGLAYAYVVTLSEVSRGKQFIIKAAFLRHINYKRRLCLMAGG